MGNYPPLGSNDGTDCSGLCQWAYKDALGVDIPRTTYEQLDQLQPIDGSNLQPGDLIYPHNGHVFMYAGNNQVVEAMKTGTNISEHEYTRKGTMFRRVLTDGSASSGVKGSSNGSSSDEEDDSSSSNPFENALNKLGTITSSYVGTILGGKAWDESMLQTKSTNSSSSISSSGGMSSLSGYQTGGSQISSAVLALRPTVEKYANQYGIGDKVDLLMAQIMQEAGGEPDALASDPMQSAEGHGMAAGSLNNQELSIQWGCEEFANRLNDAGGNIPLALQSYNFGKGFINYVKNHGGQMSQDLVDQFSDQQAAANGWSKYGDKQYVQHVLRYYNGGGSGFESMPAPLDLNSMYEMNNNYMNEGGAGNESLEMNQNSTDEFIYNNYKSANDRMSDTMSAVEYQKTSNDNVQLDEIIALLKSIDKNTFETINAVNRVSGKMDNIKTEITNSTTKIENNKNIKNEASGTKDVIDKYTSTTSSNKISEAYFKASGIARGRRR